MAKTSYIDIAPENEKNFYKSVQSGDRFTNPRICKKTSFVSRGKKASLFARSFLPSISILWNNLSEIQKTAWTTAGAECGLNGFRLFVEDQSLRIKNDLSGVATPSLLHQASVGVFQIDSPADELQVIQRHPHFYFISSKVTGKKNQYIPVKVTEDLTLPASLSLNYSSDLEIVTLLKGIFGISVFGLSEFGNEVGAEDCFARIYARFWYAYQGQNLSYDLTINLDFVNDWENAVETLTTLVSYTVGYDIYIHLKNLRGTLYTDNIKLVHSGQNWVRDTYCKNINENFIRGFCQVPKNWEEEILPAGSWIDSLYVDF